MDKFPEAFRRFENNVDIGKMESYRQLTLAFRWWAGQRWKGTSKQWNALNREAHNLGFDRDDTYRYRTPSWQSDSFSMQPMAKTWREETIEINGISKVRYRDARTGRFIKKP